MQRYYVSLINSTTNDTYYIPSNLNKVTVTGGNILYGAFYNCSSLTSITIPSGVTSIGMRAFEDCSSLTSITIPSGVTSIGMRAFYNCRSLNKVNYTGTIDQWVQIDFGNDYSNPMYYTKNLYINDVLVTEANITTATKINAYAFYRCKSLTSVTIGNSLTSIGSDAFSGCSSLKSINVNKDNVNYSSVDGILYNKSQTEFIHIPQDVKGAVTIPNTITSIGSEAFKNCSSLTSINVDKDNANYSSVDGILYNKKQTEFIHIPKGVKGAVTIPNTITSIGSEAFKNCSSLTSITIPSGVTSIGRSAFYNCSSLTNVTMGNSVTSIGDSAFIGCSSLTSITIGNSVTSIGYAAFNGCSGLEEITIPFVGTKAGKTSTDTYQYPFGYIFGTSSYTGGTETKQYYYGSSIDSRTNDTYYIPSNLNKVTVTGGNILYGAFYNCSSLTIITIGDSVTSIGDYAFDDCSSLNKVNYTGTIDQWVQIDFGSYDSNPTYYAKDLHINNKIVTEANITTATMINYSAFSDCSSLTSVTIGNSVTSIGSGAFYNCRSLNKVNYTGTIDQWVQIDFGNSYSNPTYYAEGLCINDILVTEANITTATKINAYAFYYCKSLTSVTIGNSVTSIGYAAFRGCYKLVEVINKSTLNITKGSEDHGEVGCCALNVKTEGASEIVNKDDYLFYTYDNVNYLLGYVGSATNLTLPDNYNGQNYEIYKYAFKNCSSLTSITIPNSVTSIGDYAFYNCSSLTSITIGNSVTSIGNRAFSGCSSLTSITIGSGVTSIGKYAFEDCSSLTSITIPNSVTSIGDYAFFNCSSLTSVYYVGTAAQWSKISFGLNNSNLTYATRYYYSATEPALNSAGTAYDGNYWHYADDGITPVVWKKEN